MPAPTTSTADTRPPSFRRFMLFPSSLVMPRCLLSGAKTEEHVKSLSYVTNSLYTKKRRHVWKMRQTSRRTRSIFFSSCRPPKHRDGAAEFRQKQDRPFKARPLPPWLRRVAGSGSACGSLLKKNGKDQARHFFCSRPSGASAGNPARIRSCAWLPVRAHSPAMPRVPLPAHYLHRQPSRALCVPPCTCKPPSLSRSTPAPA